jgi:hypothetical protein
MCPQLFYQAEGACKEMGTLLMMIATMAAPAFAE